MSAYASWRFTVLLVAMLLLLAARLGASDTGSSELLVESFGSTLLLAAILTLYEDRRVRFLSLLLGLPALGVAVVALLSPGETPRAIFVLGRASSSLFLGFMILVIVQFLLTNREVTRDSIAGAFCGYLLIGVVWTELYCWVVLVSPDAFSGMGPEIDVIDATDKRWMLCQYFSFVSLTTMGYGDIVPVSHVARTLACLEAICGQFYLAVLVAGLVGIRASQKVSGGREPPGSS